MSVNASTVIQDVEIFINALKEVVPSSLLSTVLGGKLAEVEETLNIIASVVAALQQLEGSTTAAPATPASS